MAAAVKPHQYKQEQVKLTVTIINRYLRSHGQNLFHGTSILLWKKVLLLKGFERLENFEDGHSGIRFI